MVNYSYQEILKAKEKCYEILQREDPELLRIFKYFKGDLMPLIHTEVRKNMTCGDIDCFQWDFSADKKIVRIIESKRTNEKQKDSQNRFLEFLSKLKIDGYKFNVFKIIGDPPFDSAEIIMIKNGLRKKVNHKQLIDFLEMKPFDG